MVGNAITLTLQLGMLRAKSARVLELRKLARWIPGYMIHFEQAGLRAQVLRIQGQQLVPLEAN